MRSATRRASTHVVYVHLQVTPLGAPRPFSRWPPGGLDVIVQGRAPPQEQLLEDRVDGRSAAAFPRRDRQIANPPQARPEGLERAAH